MENPQSSLNPTQVSTPSPTTPETTTPEAVPITPAPKKKTSKILIGVLVLLFLVAGGVFAYDYFKPKVKEDENLPTPVPQVSAEPVVDEMSGWRIIEHSDWNFKVPGDWKYLKCSPVETIFVGPQDEGWLQSDQTSACEFDARIGNLSLSKLSEINNLPIISENSEYIEVDQRKVITVGGSDATEQIETGLAGQGVGFVTKVVYIQKNGQWYTIRWSDVESEILFDQILSTFEFVETQGNTIGPSLGKVTGKLCYPSEFLPSGEIVAKNVQSGEIYTQNYSGNTENYTFELPVGTYHLRYQAHASANNPSIFTSYYHTLCGENPEYTYCQSTETHSIIPTLVKQGETTTDVNLCGEGTIEDSTF